MIILASLREGYVVVFKNWIEKSSQAKRIDIIVKDTGNDSLFITHSMIDTWKANSRIDEIIPNRTRPVRVINAEGGEQYCELISTLPGDPDLKRYGFQGQYGEREDNALSLIIREEDLRKMGYDSTQIELTLVVKRSNEAYPLDFKIIGTIDGGEPDKMYAPLAVLNYLEQWILGYGVDAPQMGIKLPPSASREEALAPPASDSCLVISTLPLDNSKTDLLNQMGLSINRLPSGPVNDFLYRIAAKGTGNLITGQRIGVIEDVLSSASTPQAIMQLPPLEIDFQGTSLSLAASITGDYRERHLLSRGQWLNTYNSRFEIVVPEEVIAGQGLPVELKARVGAAEVPFRIVGTTSNGMSYADFETLYRLRQVKQGNARMDAYSEIFEPNEAAGQLTERYLVSRVHAATLDDVAPLIEQFEQSGYDIFASSRSVIENFKKIKTILTNFVILITVIGGLACIASLVVLMYEAIKRKRNQIGIMRAMGLSRSFINQIFIWQSLIYGWLGLGLSIILFYILKTVLDSGAGHELFDIPKQEGHIFQFTPVLLLIFALSISIISFIAGRSAARSVENIDPADILAD
ncbi:MAG: FtsX-like permease family protein [Phaeodactylibacter sp.]|nr:FtsX-like permease family protein [Phaeodactylibacter sp.]